MAQVVFREVSKVFDDGTVAVDALDQTVHDGEFMVLVGSSGCGKTTALRMLAGLEEPTAGVIEIGGKVVNDVPPKSRDIAMVFQNYALYPHMTVAENIGFGLKMHGAPRAEIEGRVGEVSEMLDLGDLLRRKPSQLSGGQRQRVAMGRALARNPAVFLLDEPLSNLDAKLRAQLRADLKQLHARIRTTTIYVTHDQVEAMTLGDRIAVMSKGRLQQVGTPREVYERPANTFVAGFIGSPPMNVLAGRVTEQGVVVGDARIADPPPGARGDVLVGLRPEALGLGGGGGVGPALQVVIDVVEPLGHEVIVHGRLARAPGTALIARLAGSQEPTPGEVCGLAFLPTDAHFFDPVSGMRLDR